MVARVGREKLDVFDAKTSAVLQAEVVVQDLGVDGFTQGRTDGAARSSFHHGPEDGPCKRPSLAARHSGSARKRADCTCYSAPRWLLLLRDEPQ